MPTPALPALFTREGRRRLSQRLQYWALVAVAGLLGRLGVDRASAAMGRAWRLLAPLNKRHARVDGHLAAAFPDWTAARRRAVIGDMWENLGRTAAETILLPELLAEAATRIDWSALPPALFEPARSGAIFVSLHTGNWEVVSWPMAALGLPLHAIYKPLRNPAVETWLAEKRRALYGAGLLPIDRSITLKIKTLARAGATVAILADQKDATGFELDFFGHRAGATLFPAIIARRLDLPLFVGRSIRTGGAHFRLDGRWLPVPKTDDAHADAEALTRTIHTVFEEWIREYPAQWMWAHRKWL
jgi:KDO2-lipid IV(A) lauroyltransferase